jgi:hypothetical protein
MLMRSHPGVIRSLSRATPLPRPEEAASDYLGRAASSGMEGKLAEEVWAAWQRRPSVLPVPLLWSWRGAWRVYHCSDAILAPGVEETHHYSRQIGFLDHAGMVAPEHHKKVNLTGGEYKSCRLPQRVASVPEVRWLCFGDGKVIRSLLRRVTAVGRDTSQGWGTVAGWEVEDWPEDQSLVADSDRGPVLMRALPYVNGEPPLLGSVRSYGACSPPYWHPDRYDDVVTPC